MLRALKAKAAPRPDFRDPHAAIRLPAHRDPIQPRSHVQVGAKSVPALLVLADADAGYYLAVLAGCSTRGRR